MGTIHNLLPRLTINRKFVEDFFSAEGPCFAMSTVESIKTVCAFLVLRPPLTIPEEVSNGGFNFGHSVLGRSTFEVIHFAFEFYNFQTFNVLINPNNQIAKSVLTMMLEGGGYVFFVVNPDGTASAFKKDLKQDDLSGIRENLDRIINSKTTDAQYLQTIASFNKNPQPVGDMLNWVCRENIEYLDLTTGIMTLNPA